MGELTELTRAPNSIPERFAKYAGQNPKGELAELNRTLNFAPRGFATLAKKSFLMGELAELTQALNSTPKRFAKYVGKNPKGELVKLNITPNSAL